VPRFGGSESTLLVSWRWLGASESRAVGDEAGSGVSEPGFVIGTGKGVEVIGRGAEEESWFLSDGWRLVSS
jgi:hypothetical protein